MSTNIVCATEIPLPSSGPCPTAPDLVVARAIAQPEALAVCDGRDSLTYETLRRRAECIASFLRTASIGRGAVVGVCLDRSPEFVAAALGVMLSGAAYLPLEPTLPPQRLAYMLQDAASPCVIAREGLRERVAAQQTHVLTVETLADHEPSAVATPDGCPQPDDLAYVIYTSGSTGTPKGVEITHANLLNLITWHNAQFAVRSDDRVTQIAGLSFDAAVWELWPHLCAGASVHIPAECIRTSPEALRDYVVEQRITISYWPTPLAERAMLLEWPADTALRFMLTGGDVLHRCPPAGVPFRVVNNYGPTECTVVATSVTLPEDRDEMPAIGFPVANTQAFLLDENRREVPDGEVGELFLGGPSVARGYRNRPDLTAEKFVFHPAAGGRVYRTGDLVRRGPDGQLSFLGRADQQVKIRGYRVELEEITAVLDKHPSVAASTVVAREFEQEKQLVAYVVLAQPGTTRVQLQEFLLARLPQYMVPALFVALEALPLTSNGKVDRSALPAVTASNLLQDNEDTGAMTATEEAVAKLLTALLHVQDIGKEDNFFLIGGHSLLAAQLIARLREHFQVDVPLRALFEAPTVVELAAVVDRMRSQPCATCMPAPRAA